MALASVRIVGVAVGHLWPEVQVYVQDAVHLLAADLLSFSDVRTGRYAQQPSLHPLRMQHRK